MTKEPKVRDACGECAFLESALYGVRPTWRKATPARDVACYACGVVCYPYVHRVNFANSAGVVS